MYEMRDKKGYVAIIIACFIPVVMSLLYLSINRTSSSLERMIFENAVRQSALEAARNYMCGVSLKDQKDYTERCAATAFNAAMKSLVGLKTDVIPMKEQIISYGELRHRWFGYCAFSRRRHRVFYELWVRPEVDAASYRTIDPDADEIEYSYASANEYGYFMSRSGSKSGALVKKIFYRDSDNVNNTSMTISESGDDNLTVSVETKLSSLGNMYKASYTATRPQLNADIVIGIPVNDGAMWRDNDMYSGFIAQRDATMETPLYQIKSECKKFIREMLSYKKCGIGIIPYAGKVAVESPELAGHDLSKQCMTEAKVPQIQTISHGSYDYSNYVAVNPQVPLSESYKWISCTYNNGKGSLNDIEAANAQYERSDIVGLMHRSDLITQRDGGDIVNTDAKNLLLSQVDNNTVFLEHPMGIAYGGDANIAAGFSRAQDFYQQMALPMLGLTTKKIEMYRYCSFLNIFGQCVGSAEGLHFKNRSSFVYLPVMFGMSMLSNGFVARDGYTVSGNGNKKVLILFVNQPDLFHPHELTHFGFSNDKSHFNLIDGDLLDYRYDLALENGYYMNKNLTSQYQKNTLIKCSYPKDATDGIFSLQTPQPANLKIVARGIEGPCCVIYKNNGHGDIKVTGVEAEVSGTFVVDDNADNGEDAYKVPVLSSGSSYKISVSGTHDCFVIIKLELGGCELDMKETYEENDCTWKIRQDEKYVYLCVGPSSGEECASYKRNSYFSRSVTIKLKRHSNEPTQWKTLSYSAYYDYSTGTNWTEEPNAATYELKKFYNVSYEAYLKETNVEFWGGAHSFSSDYQEKLALRTYYQDSTADGFADSSCFNTFSRTYSYCMSWNNSNDPSLPTGATDISDMLQYIKLTPYSTASVTHGSGKYVTIELPYVRLYKETPFGDSGILNFSGDILYYEENGVYYTLFLIGDSPNVSLTKDYTVDPYCVKIKSFGCLPTSSDNTCCEDSYLYIVEKKIYSISTSSGGLGLKTKLVITFKKASNEIKIYDGIAYVSIAKMNDVYTSPAGAYIYDKNGTYIDMLYPNNNKPKVQALARIAQNGAKVDFPPDCTKTYNCNDGTITIIEGIKGRNVSFSANCVYTAITNTSGNVSASISSDGNYNFELHKCTKNGEDGSAMRITKNGSVPSDEAQGKSIRNNLVLQSIEATSTCGAKMYSSGQPSSKKLPAVYIYKYPGYYNTSESYQTVSNVSKVSGNGGVVWESTKNRWLCVVQENKTLDVKITYSKTDAPVLAKLECYSTKISEGNSYLRADSNNYYLCRNFNKTYSDETITISNGSVSVWPLSYASNVLVGQSNSGDFGCRSTEYVKVNSLPNGHSYPNGVSTPGSSNPYSLYGTHCRATPFFKKNDTSFASKHSTGTYTVSGKMDNLKVCAYVKNHAVHIAFNCGAENSDTNCSATIGQITGRQATTKTRQKSNVKFNYFMMTGGASVSYELDNGYNMIYVPRSTIKGTNKGTNIDIFLMNVKIIYIEWSNNLNGIAGARSITGPDVHFDSSSTAAGTAWHEKVKNAPYSKTNSYCSTSSYPANIPVIFKNYSGANSGFSEGRFFYDTLSFLLQNLLGDYNITWAGQEGTEGSMRSKEFMTTCQPTYNNSSLAATVNYGTSRCFQMSTANENNTKNDLSLTFTGCIRIKTIEVTNELNRILYGAGYQGYDTAKSEPTVTPTEALRRGLTPDIIKKFNATFGNNGRIYVIHYRYKPENYENTGWDPSSWGVYKNFYNVENEEDLQQVLNEIMYDVKRFGGYTDAKIMSS